MGDRDESGSKTEIAGLQMIQKAGFDYHKYRETYPFEHKFPFSSARKRMSIVI